MRILFLTDNFPPESNAPAIRTYEHCLEWVAQGAEVTVVTCAPNFPKGKVFGGYKNKLYQTEMMDGIKVVRVWTYITPNRGMVKRILDYLSFCVAGFVATLFIKTDLIVATTPQLFTAAAGYLASVFKRKPWVMEIRDLWPESIKAVGAMEQSRILKILDRVVLFLYRKADKIIVVTDAFKTRMLSLGINSDKIHVIKNGVHLSQYQPRPRDQKIIRQHHLENKFIIAYIGTHGMAHKLDFIIDCAKEVENDRIHFLFVGAGAFKSRLVRQAKKLQLKNVTLLDAIPKSRVADYINIADVALINLRKSDTFKKVLPSKIFENAAMQKPILLGVEGEAKALVTAYGAGLAFEPENKADFLQKVNLIVKDEVLYAQLQVGGLKLASDFDRQKLALEMFEVLKAVMVLEEGNVVSVESRLEE
ncbi:MAG: glycosyltransferase family 4 protein [Bacteroidota bacterium]